MGWPRPGVTLVLSVCVCNHLLGVEYGKKRKTRVLSFFPRVPAIGCLDPHILCTVSSSSLSPSCCFCSQRATLRATPFPVHDFPLLGNLPLLEHHPGFHYTSFLSEDLYNLCLCGGFLCPGRSPSVIPRPLQAAGAFALSDMYVVSYPAGGAHGSTFLVTVFFCFSAQCHRFAGLSYCCEKKKELASVELVFFPSLSFFP